MVGSCCVFNHLDDLRQASNWDVIIDMVRFHADVLLFLWFVLSATLTVNKKAPGSGLLRIEASVFEAALLPRKH